MEHQYTILKGKLMLRPITLEDIEFIRNWRNQDEIRKWFISQQKITQQEELEWFQKYKGTTGDLMFSIIWEQSFIGTVALYNINQKEGSGEFGRLMIGDNQFKGLGIGEKVTYELCQFAFNDLGLKHLYLSVLKENKKALKIYEKVGFKKEQSSKECETYKLHLYAIKIN